MQKTHPAVIAALLAPALAEDCSYFYNLGCADGTVTTNPADWANRSFQTWLPESGSENYREGYQGLGRVTCYNNIIYNSSRTSADVEARCRTHSSITSLEYNWNGEGFTDSNLRHLDSSFIDALSLTVRANDGNGNHYTIDLESPNFMW